MSEEHLLRTEATAVPYDRLTKQQQLTFQRMAAVLAESVTQLKDTPRKPLALTPTSDANSPRAAGFTIRPDSRSRILLISAARGLGKTSVLMSLILEAKTALAANSAKSKEEQPDQTRGKGAQNAKNLADGVVWLKPLDMSLLPQDANVFSAILVRIEEVAGAHAQPEPGSERPRGFLEPPVEYDRPLEALQRLQVDVAISQEGNLQRRAGAMDPTHFASEVRLAEWCRLDLNGRLADVLDSFAKRDRSDGRLYVLPIDDFDMNPARCLEILTLLRTLSVPRLFFIVLGDLSVAEVVCNLKIGADLANLGGHAAGSGFLPIASPLIRGKVADVAGNVIRKLLPAAQRLKIDLPTFDEAKGFRPIESPEAQTSSDGANTTPCKTLGELLQKIPIRERPIEKALSDRYLLRLGYTLDDLLLERGWNQSSFYAASQFLVRPLRELVDLWQLFRAAIQEDHPATTNPTDNPHRRTIDGLKEFCKDAILSEDGLTPEARVALAAEFERELGWARKSQRANIVRIRLALFPPDYQVKVPAISLKLDSGAGLDVERTVQTRSGGKWLVSDRRSPDDHDVSSARSSFSGLLIVTSDLETIYKGGGKVNPLIEFKKSASYLAALQYRIGDWKSPWLPWPIPPFLTFWEVDRFTDQWEKAAADYSRSPDAASVLPALVYHWISAGIDVLQGRKEPPTTPVEGAVVRPVNWALLRVSAQTLLKLYEPFDYGQPVLTWLGRSLSLLHPLVLGPDSSARNELARSERLKEFCSDRAAKFPEPWLAVLERKLSSADKAVQMAFFKECRNETVWQDTPPAEGRVAEPAKTTTSGPKPKGRAKRARR